LELSGRRIFVVEDEAILSMMIEEALEDMGCIVAVTASRLGEGITKAREAVIDAAVLDINLAGELSYPIANILLARGIPFVFATGYGTAGLTGPLQAVQVLAKPYRPEQLERALIQALSVTLP